MNILEAMEKFDEMINEVAGNIVIIEEVYKASDVLKRMSMTRYREMFEEYLELEGVEVNVPCQDEHKQIYDSGIIISSSSCDYNPVTEQAEQGGGQVIVVEYQCHRHSFYCDWDGTPIIYRGVTTIFA